MTENYTEEDEFVSDDIEIYEGEPDFDRSEEIVDGIQDDETNEEMPQEIQGFMARVASPVRSWQDTLEWYRNNQTTKQIGFDPDGMCLKVCRVARGIPARYPSAVEAQSATPEEFRIYQVDEFRRGMIGFFDDPHDSNRFGHVATMIGRARDHNMHDLNGTLWETNSVKSGELVIVRGTYFERYWGDDLKFAATWLNGYELDVPGRKSRLERFNNGGPVYNLNLLDKAAKNGRVKAGEILRRIEDQVRRLPDNRSINHVRQFKDEWREDRKIDMSHLDAAVENGRVGLVKTVRDEIRRLIAALPEE
jgi:hypothetical protein